MGSSTSAAPATPAEQRTQDRENTRRALLLHIAVVCPYDAAELSRWIPRPIEDIHEDITALMAEGIVHIHEAALRTSAASRIIAEAEPDKLRELQSQIVAELTATAQPRSATLVALTESGCTDQLLLRLLVRATSEHPEDLGVAAALATVARARGQNEGAIQLLQAEVAAVEGRSAQVLALTDGLLTHESTPIASGAAVLAASAHIQENRLERASVLYRHIGSESLGEDGAWAIVAALGRGDLGSARSWREALGDDALTSHAAGVTDLVDGLLLSLEGNGDGALELLARSVATLTPLGKEVILPDTPAAFAALVAISRGEPATAEVLLARALRADLGGKAARKRHLLLSSWSLMVQGRMNAAERILEDFDQPSRLCNRDLLLFWCLRAGIARRRTDAAGVRAAWQEVRGHTFGMDTTLYDLLPIGEMMVVAARLRDTQRIGEMAQQGMGILTALGDPITWSVPIHWYGVQAAFQAADPAALLPHANELVKAGRTSTYATTLAQAGHTWLEVLRGEADFASVEASTRSLASVGQMWDAARLAGQAALQHPEREGALSLMQLAREISRDQLRTTEPSSKGSVLTARELEVAHLVLAGQGYRAIGEQLFISPKTVEHHVARIRSRLGAASRADLLERLHDILSELER